MMVEQGIEAFHDDYGVYPPEYYKSKNAEFFKDKNAADNPFNKDVWKPDYEFNVYDDNVGFLSGICGSPPPPPGYCGCQ